MHKMEKKECEKPCVYISINRNISFCISEITIWPADPIKYSVPGKSIHYKYRENSFNKKIPKKSIDHGINFSIWFDNLQTFQASYENIEDSITVDENGNIFIGGVKIE